MKPMTQHDIMRSAAAADTAAATCYEEVRRLIGAAKRERDRRTRAGVEPGGGGYVIERLSEIRDSLDRLGLGSRLNALGCQDVVPGMLDGWQA